MKNTEIVALSKVLKKKAVDAAREELPVGDHEIDMTVQLTGTLSVSEDYDKAATASLLNQDFFLLVLKNSGVTRDAAAKAIAEIATEYLTNWSGSDNDKAEAKALRKEKVAEFDPKGEIQAIFNDLKITLPSISAKGPVKFKGQVEAIEAAEHESVTEVAVAEVKEAK